MLRFFHNHSEEQLGDSEERLKESRALTSQLEAQGEHGVSSGGYKFINTLSSVALLCNKSSYESDLRLQYADSTSYMFLNVAVADYSLIIFWPGGP